ncbi:MAG: DUF2892 domain-containing protein [Candidatus Brocadiia bacterium]
MLVDNYIHIFAGVLSVAGVGLGYFISPWYFLIPVFVGLNLLQYGFTDFCPMGVLLRRVCGVEGNRARKEND